MGFVGFLLLTAGPGVFLSQQCPVSQYYDGMSWFRLHLTCLGLMIGLLAHVLPAHAGSGKPVSERMWQQVVTEAARLDLPTKLRWPSSKRAEEGRGARRIPIIDC